MRVLIYAIDFAPKVGGEETYLLHLGRGLAEERRQGKRVEPGEAKSTKPESDRWSLIVVTRTAASGFNDGTLPFPVVRQPSLGALWRLLGEADVVHLSGPVLLPLLLGLLRGKSIVISHHLYHAVCPNGLLLYEPANSICPGNFMAGRYDACVRCNAATLGWGRSLLILLATFPRRWMCKGVSANMGITSHVSQRLALPRTKTIYYGIPDLSISSSASANARARAFILSLAYVGRLVKEKGLPLLLQAVKGLEESGYRWQLKIIGDGPERSRLEAMGRALGLERRIEFTGLLQGSRLEEALADVAAVVMPSVWEETAGLAAIEQMMRGRLVIAADLGGLAEVVGDAGLKFRAGDVKDLTACLQRLVDEPGLAGEMGRQARARALRLFQHERMLHEHYQLYQQLRKDAVGGSND